LHQLEQSTSLAQELLSCYQVGQVGEEYCEESFYFGGTYFQ